MTDGLLPWIGTSGNSNNNDIVIQVTNVRETGSALDIIFIFIFNFFIFGIDGPNLLGIIIYCYKYSFCY